MVHRFDQQATELFFNETFGKLVEPQLPKGLRHRDRLLLAHIMEPRRAASPRVIDFGCGQGQLLSHLLADGYDAMGMEVHEGMRRVAAGQLASMGRPDRILTGGVAEFKCLPPESFDVVVMMGVFQYLSDQDYDEVFAAAARVLRPHGCLAATFQNALFDLFTFNKYTVDFFMHQLVGPLSRPADRDRIEQALATLISHPDKPEYSPARARDNVFVRLTNPLLIADQVARYGFEVRQKYFYEWFGLPPLLGSQFSEIARPIAEHFEVQRAAAWQGHFMANAFLAELTRR
jgi:SAM-dependent methyltransferase